MIRPAIMDDVPTLVEMGRALHAESPRWSRLPFNDVKVTVLLSRLITDPNGFLYVHEGAGGIDGGLAAIVEPHWASDALLAHELSLFVRPGARGSMAAVRLIAHLDAWAERKGAAWLNVGISTGVQVERTTQLYQRLGFSPCSVGLEMAYGN